MTTQHLVMKNGRPYDLQKTHVFVDSQESISVSELDIKNICKLTFPYLGVLAETEEELFNIIVHVQSTNTLVLHLLMGLCVAAKDNEMLQMPSEDND